MATTFSANTVIKSAEVNANFLEKLDKATLTTKGDSYVATGAGVVVRQAVGADGTFLFADAAQTNGIRYVHGLGDVQTKTTTYTAVMTDFMVLCSTAGGAWTLTFPTAVGCSGKILGCKKTTSDFSAVTLAGTGMSTNYLMTIGETAWFVSDGTNWVQIARKTEVPWTSFTPTGTMSTNTTYTGFWRRSGDSIEMEVKIAFAGAPNAVNLTVNIVNSAGWTIDTAKLSTSTSNDNLGMCSILDSGTANFNGVVAYSTNVILFPLVGVASGTYLSRTVISATTPMTIASGDLVHFKTLPIPITNFSA